MSTSVGRVLVSYNIFLSHLVRILKKDGERASEVLDDIHEINKEVYAILWKKVFLHSKSYVNKGVYSEFKFKDGRAEFLAHYFMGQKYARELTSSESRYTGRILSIEEDGIYLNHRKVEII